LLARWKDATSDDVMSEAMRESRSAGDSVVSYVLFAFVLIHLRDVSRGSNLIAVLGVFVLVFLMGNYLKSYLARAIGRSQQQHKSGRGQPGRVLLLEEISRIFSWLIIYTTILLVQVVLKRVDPGISDGHFSPVNLVLPLAFFLLLFVVWHVYGFRSEPPPVEEPQPGGNGKSAAKSDINDGAAAAAGMSLAPGQIPPIPPS
jgi:hypothetical protein